MQTSLVDYLDNTIKNTVDYEYQKKDLFFNTKISAFENLSKTGNERFEYIYIFTNSCFYSSYNTYYNYKR